MSVFNDAEILSESLDSILSQKGVNLEFIVVNDGSTDGSPAILREYSAKHSRVRVLDQENHGLTRSLIRGCAEAKGEFIARQDAGDLSRPHRLVRQLEVLCKSRELAFVSCWTEFVGPKKEFLYTNKGKANALTPTWILSERENWGVIDGPTCHGSVMCRRDSYDSAGGYRKVFFYGQDWDLWYRMAKIGKFQIVDEPLYQARVTADSLSAGNRKKQKAIGRLSRAALSLRLHGQDDTAILMGIAKICSENVTINTRSNNALELYHIAECLRRNKDTRCYEYFWNAIKVRPIFWRAWARVMQSFVMK
jgi:glycosyltransferase involved in cell wall biosynthesis